MIQGWGVQTASRTARNVFVIHSTCLTSQIQKCSDQFTFICNECLVINFHAILNALYFRQCPLREFYWFYRLDRPYNSSLNRWMVMNRSQHVLSMNKLHAEMIPNEYTRRRRCLSAHDFCQRKHQCLPPLCNMFGWWTLVCKEGTNRDVQVLLVFKNVNHKFSEIFKKTGSNYWVMMNNRTGIDTM